MTTSSLEITAPSIPTANSRAQDSSVSILYILHCFLKEIRHFIALETAPWDMTASLKPKASAEVDIICKSCMWPTVEWYQRSVFSHSLLPRSLLKLKGCGKHRTQTNSPCSVAHTTFLPIIRCDKHERGQSKGQDTQRSCHTKLLKHAQCSVGLLKASHAVGQEHQMCSKTASRET